MAKLVLPSTKYKASFIKDFLPHMGKSRIKYESVRDQFGFKNIKGDFGGFLKFLRAQSNGLNLPPGYIPQTVYWLVDGKQMLGWLSLRHRLNQNLKIIGGHIGYEVTPKYRGRGYGKEILRLGLLKAKQRGIKKVFITCDADNIRSKKVIEHNGGQAVEPFWQKDKKIFKLRYWITL